MDRNSAPRGYDIIGDVHGCGRTLARLLEKLDYHLKDGVYFHPERQAIFLGDIIDRGPQIREALRLVRDMVEAGSAQMILGNHEYNAIAYFTPHPEKGPGHYLRPHTPRNARQLAETLAQFDDDPDEWQAYLDWFLTLPLFLEFDTFRVVHACWDAHLIAQHRERYGDGAINRDFLYASAEPGSLESKIRQRLTGGVDLPLPEGMRIVSNDGLERRKFRVKFWEADAQTYDDLLFQPDPLPPELAERPITPEDRRDTITYGPEQPPLFVGHYWLKGRPRPITSNIACLDYSAVKFGRLVAYRYDGEPQLLDEKFVWTYVDP